MRKKSMQVGDRYIKRHIEMLYDVVENVICDGHYNVSPIEKTTLLLIAHLLDRVDALEARLSKLKKKGYEQNKS